MIDEAQVRLAIDLIKNNGLVEVRVIGDGKFDVWSGYFKNVDNLVSEVRKFDKQNVYIVLNKINDACYSRTQQERILKGGTTTSDNDIEGREWILIDIDPSRPSKVGATDAEIEKAKQVGYKVYKFLRDVGFPEPVSGNSGNGFHLLYKVALQNTPERTELIKDFLFVLDMYFSDGDASIDKSVFNSSRISKLFGTVARKGSNTSDRPHRLSRITKAPNEIKKTDVSLIEKVANMKPKAEVKARYNNYNTEQFDLDSFISKHHIQVQGRSRFSEGEKIVLDHCLFDHSHRAKDAAIFKMNNGAIGYRCFHNSCSDKKWQDVRLLFEPTAYDYKNRNQGYNAFGTKPVVKQLSEEQKQKEINKKGEKFLEFSSIKEVDRSNLVYIKTHIPEIDKKIIGWLKGELTVISGLSASGKSTILGQFALNAIEDGFKVGLFSGELQAHRAKNWIQLQASGRQFTTPTKYDSVFTVNEKHKRLIDVWIKDKLYIYNNEYGHDFVQMIKDFEDYIVKNSLDLIILDNLMVMQIDALSSNNYGAQGKAVQALSSLAKRRNVHILLVAHPKKTTSFLRAEDISGASEIRNLADNIIVVHRCNKDFKVRMAEYFGEAEASRFDDNTNTIEVCKNRDIGIQDLMVGLYYEVESKRMLSEPYENIIYGWQELLDDPLPQMPDIKPDSDAFLSEKAIEDAPF